MCDRIKEKQEQDNEKVSALDSGADDYLLNDLILSTDPDHAIVNEWIFDITEQEATRLWAEKYKDIAFSSDVDYDTYMFGDEKAGIPWCAGYAVGFRLVQNYLQRNKKTVAEILEIAPHEMIG